MYDMSQEHEKAMIHMCTDLWKIRHRTETNNKHKTEGWTLYTKVSLQALNLRHRMCVCARTRVCV